LRSSVCEERIVLDSLYIRNVNTLAPFKRESILGKTSSYCTRKNYGSMIIFTSGFLESMETARKELNTINLDNGCSDESAAGSYASINIVSTLTTTSLLLPCATTASSLQHPLDLLLL